MTQPWLPSGGPVIQSQATRRWNDFVSSAPVASGFKVWNGSAWVLKPCKVWDGSAWVTRPVKYWDGTQWALSTL